MSSADSSDAENNALRCDGWVAGLRLLSMQLGTGIGGCGWESHHDYFASELFGRMPAVTQDLLLRAAPFDHPLFREFLLHRLQARGNRQDIAAAGVTQKLLAEPPSVRLLTLGRFEVSVGGQPLIKRKMPRKSLMLLKTLIALGGSDIPEHMVADELWPNSDGDAARRALTTALYRLRKLLGGTSTLEVRAGRISINPNRVWIDSWAFEALSEQVDNHLTQGRDGPAAQALSLYQGTFLSGDQDILGAERKRETLRRKFVRLITCEARRLEERGAFAKASSLYSQALSVESANESFHEGLDRCHAAEYPRPADQNRRTDGGFGTRSAKPGGLGQSVTDPCEPPSYATPA